MNLPYPGTDSIPIIIRLTNGIDRYGQPKVVKEVHTKCTLSEKNLYIRDTDGKLIRLESRLYIKGDVAPEVDLVEGKVILFEKEYNVYKVARPRDHKGVVHHTKLELI